MVQTKADIKIKISAISQKKKVLNLPVYLASNVFQTLNSSNLSETEFLESFLFGWEQELWRQYHPFLPGFRDGHVKIFYLVRLSFVNEPDPVR